MEALSQDRSGLGVWVERQASEREGSGEGVKDQSPGSQGRGLVMGAEALTQVPECFLCQEGKDLGPGPRPVDTEIMKACCIEPLWLWSFVV